MKRAWLILSILLALCARSEATNRDTTVTSQYVLDSTLHSSLLPFVTIGIGAGFLLNNLSDINGIVSAHEPLFASEGYSIQSAPETFSKIAFDANLRFQIVPFLGLYLNTCYSGTYGDVTASLIATHSPSEVATYYVGLGGGYFTFSDKRNYGVAGPSDNSGGYNVLDNVEYSGGAGGFCVLAGLDLMETSPVGLGLEASYNKVSPIHDAQTGRTLDLSGFELGAFLTFHFWAPNSRDPYGTENNSRPKD